MNNKFAENLKKIRKENKLSQEQLADELGVSRQAISKWESAIAYPEMDKIIALCDKFNLNIDDLLHKDIKEVKGEEESKNKLNNFIDDFLKFITSTINLFSSMNFKSKVKCLLEESIIALILFIISLIIFYTLDNLFNNILSFLPNNICSFITNILQSILVISLLIISVIIITHIFKTRYLNYYEKTIKKDIEIDKIPNNNSIPNNNKIIIRDPKHSEYKFINYLFKSIIYIIKFFLLCTTIFIAFILIGLLCSLIISFLLYKTGYFFIGLIITILSSASITIIILLLILNFVFNRKNNKKMIIWTFIISLVTFGIGCGLISIGTLSFNITDNNDKMLKTISKEYDMKDNLFIYQYDANKIEYIESSNNNIKIDYLLNKYYEIDDSYSYENKHIISPWPYCKNPIKLVREYITNINDKKIIPINNRIEKITIYTTKSNIEKLKSNWEEHIERRNSYDDIKDYYEKEIDELEKENSELKEKIYDLESK